jgi:hypothetical protein
MRPRRKGKNLQQMKARRRKIGEFMMLLLIAAGVLIIFGHAILLLFLVRGTPGGYLPWPHAYRPWVPAYYRCS